MRYYQKLVSLLVLVLAASFGVGGCVLLYSDFAVQRGRMATANAAAHAQTCTLLQTEILDLQRRGTTMDDAALTARVEARDTPAALWRGDTLICATLPGRSAPRKVSMPSTPAICKAGCGWSRPTT